MLLPTDVVRHKLCNGLENSDQLIEEANSTFRYCVSSRINNDIALMREKKKLWDFRCDITHTLDVYVRIHTFMIRSFETDNEEECMSIVVGGPRIAPNVIGLQATTMQKCH